MQKTKPMIKYIFTFVFVLAFALMSMAQDNLKTANIKTGFHCPNGKALLEKELVKIDGVKEVTASMETKVVSIKYDSSILDEKQLIIAIEKVGYPTEFTPADKKINKACSHGEGEEGHNH